MCSVTPADQFVRPVINHIDPSHWFIDFRRLLGSRPPPTGRIKLSRNVTSLPVTCRRVSHTSLCSMNVFRRKSSSFAERFRTCDFSECRSCSCVSALLMFVRKCLRLFIAYRTLARYVVIIRLLFLVCHYFQGRRPKSLIRFHAWREK